MGKFKAIAAEVGELVTAKNLAYGDSFAKTGDFLRILYPAGIPPEQYGDALCMVRIFDKQMRVATAKDALGESPYRDIAGYAVLGIAKDAGDPGYVAFAQETTFGSMPAPHGGYRAFAVNAATSATVEGAENCANYDTVQCVDCYHCGNYVRTAINPPPAREPLNFTLPTITQEGDISAVLAKHREEWQEWVKTERGSMAELIEAWDVMQAERTYYERGGETGILAEGMLSNLETWHSEDRPVMQAKRIMLIKNAARQKYSDEDCARILADV